MSVADALEDPRARGNLTCTHLLRAQPRWGVKRARRCMAAAGIRENKPVAELTERQRRVLRQAIERG